MQFVRSVFGCLPLEFIQPRRTTAKPLAGKFSATAVLGKIRVGSLLFGLGPINGG